MLKGSIKKETGWERLPGLIERWNLEVSLRQATEGRVVDAQLGSLLFYARSLDIVSLVCYIVGIVKETSRESIHLGLFRVWGKGRVHGREAS